MTQLEIDFPYSNNIFIYSIQTCYIYFLGVKSAESLSHRNDNVTDPYQYLLIKCFPSIKEFRDEHSILLSTCIMFILGILIGITGVNEYVITLHNHPEHPPNIYYTLLWHRGYCYIRWLSIIEYICLSYIFPQWYTSHYSTVLMIGGISITLIGRFLRNIAMLQAGRNFQYVVRTDIDDQYNISQVDNSQNAELKKQHHPDQADLITSGSYAFVRHPSYTASIIMHAGMMLLILQAPFIGIIGTLLQMGLVYVRAAKEEVYLHNMFGTVYEAYQHHIPPFWPIVLGGQSGKI